MSHHAPKTLNDMDTAVLGEKAWPLWRGLMLAAVIGLILAAVATPFSSGGWKRLGFAYIIGFCFALAIALGCFFFVLSTTVFRAGWCVAFRRVPETIAATIPTMGALAIPILIMAFFSDAGNFIYPWSQEGILEEGKRLVEHKPEVKDFGSDQKPEDKAARHWTHTYEHWYGLDHATPYFVYKKKIGQVHWYTPLFLSLIHI